MNCPRLRIVSCLIFLTISATGFRNQAQGGTKAKVPHPRPMGRAASPMPRGMAGVAHRGAGMPRRNYGNAYRRNMVANQNNSQAIAPLQSAATSLTQADHDYQGHRAKALHSVSAAIRHLEPPAVRRNLAGNAGIGNVANRKQATLAGKNGGAGGSGKGKANNSMPQAVSDSHLRDALQSLNGVRSMLANSSNSGHRAQALIAVQNAIQEIDQALAIR